MTSIDKRLGGLEQAVKPGPGIKVFWHDYDNNVFLYDRPADDPGACLVTEAEIARLKAEGYTVIIVGYREGPIPEDDPETDPDSSGQAGP